MSKKLKSDLNNLKDLSLLVTTYEEIAAMRMRKIKTTVLQNRSFLSDLNNIYGYVKSNYKGDIIKINIKKKLNIGKKTKGTVSVFLSANTGLYGEIVRNTFDLFEEETSKKKTDVIIVGKIGKKLYEEKFPGKQYTYFNFTDSVVSQGDIQELLTFCLQYEYITMYHGFFASILSQTPVSTNVTGESADQSANRQQATDGVKEKHKVPAEDIFEPSLSEIVEFFERQILSSIFEQSLYESSLSKFAARMLNLDLATSRITSNLKQTNFKIQKSHHSLMQRHQMDVLASMGMWGGKNL